MRANFTLSDGDKAVTDADDKAKVTLKGTEAGAHTVTASMVGNKSGQLVVNFTTDMLTARVNLNVTGDNFIANNIGITRPQAAMIDGNGSPVEDIKINFRGTSVMLSSANVEADGQVFAEILMISTEVGLKTISASLADKPTEVISRLLNARVGVNPVTITSQGVPEGQVTVAQDMAVKTHVNDQFGNPMTHQPAIFSAAPSSQMIISQNTVSTNTQGVAEVTMTSERDGLYTVKTSLANGASLERQLETIDEKLTLTSSPLIGANVPKGVTLTATLTPANGTPAEGQVINFSVALEGAALSGGKVRTNSSDQVPIVLTSSKAGTYTVTASFHSGVTIQTQTTVGVAGNPSTTHVTSFIVDPSIIAAANNGLGILKAAVGDDSGSLIEGLTVYFVLKNGSTTLMSLTAVTDQNGIATTSVKETIAGGVTVNTVISADGMQAVDISLMAGLADAPQSTLKNNQSSLGENFTGNAELHPVLCDISGNSIKVSEGMGFVQSDANVPYMKISAIDYSQNISGDYKATVTGDGEGIATLVPVLNGACQAGLSTTIEFISAKTGPMTGTVSVNSANLPIASFPSQGFTGAYYRLNNDSFVPGKTAADYSFSSPTSWIGVDTTGKVTFKNDSNNNTVIIIVPPRSGDAVYQIVPPGSHSVRL